MAAELLDEVRGGFEVNWPLWAGVGTGLVLWARKRMLTSRLADMAHKVAK